MTRSAEQYSKISLKTPKDREYDAEKKHRFGASILAGGTGALITAAVGNYDQFLTHPAKGNVTGEIALAALTVTGMLSTALSASHVPNRETESMATGATSQVMVSELKKEQAALRDEKLALERAEREKLKNRTTGQRVVQFFFGYDKKPFDQIDNKKREIAAIQQKIELLHEVQNLSLLEYPDPQNYGKQYVYIRGSVDEHTVDTAYEIRENGNIVPSKHSKIDGKHVSADTLKELYESYHGILEDRKVFEEKLAQSIQAVRTEDRSSHTEAVSSSTPPISIDSRRKRFPFRRAAA